jgi:hypothetical protein
MNSNKKQVILRNILTFIQILVFIPSILLEYFSTEKMGVIRYLVFKKQRFEETLFNSHLINLYKLILILGILICIILLIYNYNKMRDIRLTKTIIAAIVSNLTGIIFIFNKHIELLNAYYFFLIAIFIITALQYIKLVTKYLVEK